MIPSRYFEPAYDAIPLSSSTAYDAIALHGRPVSLKVVGTGGSLVCVTASGQSRTLTVADNEEIPLLVNSISASTNVDLRLYVWGRR